MNIDEIAKKIINSPLFLKLKPVIENNDWHDNESVYDHLIKTYEIAKDQITGDFITNVEAKKLFLEFVNSNFEGIKMSDVMILTALIHDIGKALYYKENQEEKPLRHVNNQGITRFPGHPYWSSTLVFGLLKEYGLSEKLLEKIASVVRLHDTFNDVFLANTSSWKMEDVIDEVKTIAENYHIEALFNIYCDEFTAEVSRDSIKKMIEIFNSPLLYSKREYFIASNATDVK